MHLIGMKAYFWVFVVALVYLLQQGSQLALTPIGEGMDSYYHWAYIVYLSNEGKIPLPGQVSVTEAVPRLSQVFPAPDMTLGERYAQWARLTGAERAAIKAAALAPTGLDYYQAPNYESQHPPLYYFLLSKVYPLVRNIDLDRQIAWLSFLSILISALALPAIYLTFRIYFGPAASVLLLLALVWFPNLMPFLGRITNDTLSFPIAAWLIYFCLSPHRSPGKVFAAGGLLCLGFFTKSYFFTLAPLYMVTAAGFQWKKGRLLFSVRSLVTGAALALLGFGALMLFNQATTGHILLLTEVWDTDQVPLVEKLLAMLRIDPIWFYVRGLFRLMIWSGYWSFVSPGIAYYLPAVIGLGWLGLKPVVEKTMQNRFFAIQLLWPHYLAIAVFVLGMLWHAALFYIRSGLVNDQVRTGNEGWYLDVLIGCFFTILAVLARARLAQRHKIPLLCVSVIGMVILNLIARLTLYMFWTGQVHLMTFIRGVTWSDVFSAVLHPETWQNWLSLPGIIQPAWLAGGVPLLLALTLSWFVLTEQRRCSAPPLLS